MEELEAFLREELEAVRAAVEESGAYSAPTWTSLVLELLEEQGILAGEGAAFRAPVQFRVNRQEARLDGWSCAPDGTQLDLIVTDLQTDPVLETVDSGGLRKLRDRALYALNTARQGGHAALSRVLDPSMEEFETMLELPRMFQAAQRIRVVVLTSRRSVTRSVAIGELDGKDVLVEIVDLVRLLQLRGGARGRSELTADFVAMTGASLPCLPVSGDGDAFDVVMTVIPGEVMYELYRRYGERLLEANVRSFLQATGKVNRGIAKTLRDEPKRFLWYNNGMVLTAEGCELEEREGGVFGLKAMKGFQVVNGGQTTASIYFQRKESRGVDLRQVRVPAKILVFNPSQSVRFSEAEQEELVDRVSRYANSQNQVKMADLSARHPLHLKLEAHSKGTFIPREDQFATIGGGSAAPVDPAARWFYERAAGSYGTLLRMAGNASQRRHLSERVIPKARLITKEELGKYVLAWGKQPNTVSRGKQGCFTAWMKELEESAHDPSQADFKRYMAMAILYRRVEDVIKPHFVSFRGNIAPYTVAVLSLKLGTKLDLMKVWNQQGLSGELRQLVVDWSRVVHQAMKDSAGERMLSEWAKREGCWAAVSSASYPMPPVGSIPELT
jgi:hypothetical protein